MAAGICTCNLRGLEVVGFGGELVKLLSNLKKESLSSSWLQSFKLDGATEDVLF